MSKLFKFVAVCASIAAALQFIPKPYDAFSPFITVPLTLGCAVFMWIVAYCLERSDDE